MASELYIKKMIDKKLSEETYVACYNLSTILGDSNGYLSRNTITEVLRDLSITSPGYVLLGETDVIKDDSVLTTDAYISEVSSYAFDTYILLKSSSNDMLSEMLGVNSPLLNQITTTIPAHLRIAINAIYLETVVLYFGLLFATSDQGIKTINMADLTRMDSNIRWISNRLESQDKIAYGLVAILRDLQRTVLYVRSLSYLFKQTYANKLGGEEDVPV